MVGPASGQREMYHASLAYSRIPTSVLLGKTVLLATNPLHTKQDDWILCLLFFFFAFLLTLCLSWSIKTPASKLSGALWQISPHMFS